MEDLQLRRLFLLITLLWSSCRPSEQGPTPTETDNQISSTRSAITNSDFIIATEDMGYLRRRCAKASDRPLPELSGSLVYKAPSIGNSSIRIVNLQTYEEVVIGHHLLFASSSASGNWIAFQGIKEIVITNPAGEINQRIPDEDDTLGLAGWTGEQYIVVNQRRAPYGEVLPLPIFSVIDIQTDARQNWFPENFPNLDTLYGRAVHWTSSSKLVINSALNHVVYPASGPAQPLVLWDLLAGVEVARVYGANRNFTPVWHPDGLRVLVDAPLYYMNSYSVYGNVEDGLPDAGGTDLFWVGINGEVERLTYFAAEQPTSQYFYVLSPSQDKIAFVLNSPGDEPFSGELAVVDLNTGEAVSYCTASSAPIWSPDGASIIFPVYNDDHSVDIYLLNVLSAEIWELFENVVPFAWVP